MAKRSDGRYVKKITLPDGSKKYIYGASQAEVNRKARDYLNAAEAGVDLDDNTTVGEWAVEWFATYKSRLRSATIASYKNSYNNHIYEILQKMPLKQVRQIHIQKVMNGVMDYSEDLQRKVLNTMRQIFKTAMQNGLIIRDPTDGIKITPHAENHRIKVLSPEQQEKLLLAVENPRARLFCAIGLYCGLRREEILGLTWSDISKESLTVNRAATFVKNRQDENHELKSKAAHRTVPIPPPLRAILDETPKENIFLFTGANGAEMTQTSFRRMWEYVTKAVNFHVHPHMLRHSYATSLYRAGIDLKTAQYLLGHSDIKMTANIYTHIEKSQVDDARKKLFSLWDDKKMVSKAQEA